MVQQDASLNVSCWSYELGCGVVLGNAQEAIWGVAVGLEDVGNVGDLSSHLVSAQSLASSLS